MSRPHGGGLHWHPRQLGRSLPIYRELWWSRAVALALTLALGGLLLAEGCSDFDPDVTAVPKPAEAERLVEKRLARLAAQIEPWAPGPPLPETEAPEWMDFPMPELWAGAHPDDVPLTGRAARRMREGRRSLTAGAPGAAAVQFTRAAEEQPTWEALFGSGLALLEYEDYRRALTQLDRADDRLDELAAAGAGGADLYAGQIATRYAAGRSALVAGDCLTAIQRLRTAVSALRGYVDIEAAPVLDRKWPFRVSEAGVDNHAVWGTLAHAYAECEDEFPRNYPKGYGTQSFSGEYDDADSPEVKEGFFPASLDACIRAGRAASSRCWAYSNLNTVLWANRGHLPLEGKESDIKLDRVLQGGLAQLVYGAAWLGATAEEEVDRQQASLLLDAAARLDRQAKVPGLAERVAELGRYLAPLTGNYSSLAEPYRRRPLTEVTLEADLAPEQLKGLAWALSERWLDHLERGKPDQMMKEIDGQVLRAGSWGSNLKEWKESVEDAMHDALADEVRINRRNQNLGAALAIRDFRADWLGDGWPAAGRNAWLSPGMIGGWAVLALLFLLGTAIVWLIHRLIVYPYLLYTTDFYRREHNRRHAELKKAGKLFTKEEIEGAG